MDSAIHEAFWRETGLTFTHWRSTARMRTARDLLADGAKPSAVARRVGYTQVSNGVASEGLQVMWVCITSDDYDGIVRAVWTIAD